VAGEEFRATGGGAVGIHSEGVWLWQNLRREKGGVRGKAGMLTMRTDKDQRGLKLKLLRVASAGNRNYGTCKIPDFPSECARMLATVENER